MTEGTEMTNSIVTKDSLVGVWKLVELKSIGKEDQKVVYPFGKDPVSYIIYTKEGYVSLSLMASNRLNLGLPIQNLMDMGYGRQPKVNIFNYIKAVVRYLQAAQQYVSYTGKYEVRDNQLFHDLDMHLVPDLIGTQLKRTLEFSGDKHFQNVLYPEYTVYSTWQRVS